MALLRTQNSQQRLIYWLEQPEEFDKKYQELQNSIYSLKLSLSEVKNQKKMEQAVGLQELIKNYYSLLSNYIQQL
ncbi:hypothetical protein [Microcoleus sp. LEGE 07076]|uniref:hypothetical protein n=1 Tax=Microcoleus sp. LEGE 07076 TaxID=915322 RepID=UPI001D14C4C2|nr:hypothetical protein [Microcoleus sp. LEGE 07076]